MKILIVDDSPTSRELTSYHLGELNYTDFIEAENGYDALAKLKEHPDIRLILLDLHMAGMGGFEFLQKRQEDQVSKHVPVALITSETDDEKKVKALMEYDVDFFIQKPVTKQSFVRLFSKLEQ